nr:molybdopterin-dependent oxidoreductase [Granulosicoccus sp.]
MSTGKAVPHDSAVEHVTGRARYVDDTVLAENQLHVAVGYAPFSCGQIDRVVLDGVRSAPGVVDLIVAEDLPAETDIGPVFPGDLLLSSGEVAYYGQPVFAVAARTHQSAVQAAAKATYEYTEAQPLLNLAEAAEKQAYVRPPHTMRRGNSSAALQASPRRVSGEMAIGGQEHFYLEGQVARVWPEEHGGVSVLSSNQNPTEAQHMVAKVLGIPMHKVVVETRRMGGGFGGKETQATACCALAAVFAVRLNAPVSCRLSRRDDMIMTGKRHNFINRYEVGFDTHGVINAAELTLIGQCGHSPDLSDAIVDRAMFHSDNAYYYPDVTIEGLRCKTNTVSNTAFRGFGGPQGMLAAETIMDEIAYATQIDPLEVRKRNLYGGDTRNETPYGQRVTTFTVPQMLDSLEASCEYQKRRISVRQFNNENQVIKKGLALTPVKFGISFTVKHLNQGAALIQLYSDGSVQLNHGGTEM